jgi:hypothetical protein
MNACWATEKIDPAPLPPCGLITEQTNCSIFFENSRNIRRTPLFWKYLLPS